MNGFLEKQGKNPTNSKPFWGRINKLKGNKSSKSIPTLKTDDKLVETDEGKANLFDEILKDTFSDQNNEKVDDIHKTEIENFVKNHDFEKHK